MIKGILFDKDGTLVTFSEKWAEATSVIVENYCKGIPSEKRTQKNSILKQLGVVNGKVIEGGVIAEGSVKDIAVIISRATDFLVQEVMEDVKVQYLQQLKRDSTFITPLGDVHGLFCRLKKLGYIIGVATGDDYMPSVFTMEAIHVMDDLSFIATSDRYPQKPAADMASAFCERFSLLPEEVIYVGDTETDMQFSKHVAYGVGVLSGIGTKQTLSRYSDFVVPTIHDLLDENDCLLGSD